MHSKGFSTGLSVGMAIKHYSTYSLELAGRVGAARQTIIALEAGKYAPSLLLAFRLASAFGVKTEDVFQWDGE